VTGKNGQKWLSQTVDKPFAKWGRVDVEVSFGSTFHWPTWENREYCHLLEKQRDLYRFIHDLKPCRPSPNKAYTPRK